ELITVSGFIHPTIMAKTEWFKNNYYDVEAVRIEDLELWHRAKGNYNFKMLTEPLFYYREFNGGYYKKYLAAQKAKKHILSKYPNNRFWIKYFKNNFITGKIYQLFDFFNKESFLINRRNEVIFEKVKSYKETI
ncbi:MAG: glycosyl transferase family 2, partial [Algoriella sp.]